MINVILELPSVFVLLQLHESNVSFFFYRFLKREVQKGKILHAWGLKYPLIMNNSSGN